MSLQRKKKKKTVIIHKSNLGGGQIPGVIGMVI